MSNYDCPIAVSVSTANHAAGEVFWNDFAHSSLAINSTTDENSVKCTLDVDTTFSKLWIYVGSNDRATSTLVFRKNGATASMSVAITGTGFFYDASGSDALVSTDQYNVQVTVGTGGSTFIVYSMGVLATPQNGSIRIIGGVSNVSASTAGSSNYCPFYGFSNATAETQNQTKMPSAGTIDKFRVWAINNARGTNSTVVSRKNGSNGNCSITITASTTGEFTDLSNSDTVAVDDLYNFVMTLGTGTGSLNIRIHSKFLASGSTFPWIASRGGAGRIINASTTYYQVCSGALGFNITESSIGAQHTYSTPTFSYLGVYCKTKGISGNTTIQLRKNMATDLSVLTTITGTGWFFDSTNNYTAVSTDYFNCKGIGGAGGTNDEFAQIVIACAPLLSGAAFSPIDDWGQFGTFGI